METIISGEEESEKVASYVSCRKVCKKYLHLQGLYKAPLVKFEAVEDIINSISATEDNALTKTSKNIYKHAMDCHQNYLPQSINSTKQCFSQKSKFSDDSRQN